MTDANKFTLTTDYATLKNDSATTSVSVTVPGSVSVAVGAAYSISADITLGTAGAIIRSIGTSSKDSSKRYVASTLDYQRTGTSGGFATIYNVLASLTRVSSTTVRLTAIISNPTGATMTGEAGSETFTFYVTTFLSPFN